jgi:hypothetical protein
MIEMLATVQDYFESVLKAAEKARVKSLNHAAGSLRKRAIASITPSREAAPPGHPPHTRRGLFHRAILYYVDPHGEFAVIGPDASVAGDSGQAHEFGSCAQRWKRRWKSSARNGPARSGNRKQETPAGQLLCSCQSRQLPEAVGLPEPKEVSR